MAAGHIYHQARNAIAAGMSALAPTKTPPPAII
jgi:hypothetical protein